MDERPRLSQFLKPRRAGEVLLLTLVCWALSSPGLLWLWENASVERQPPAALLQLSAMLLFLCWAIHRFWGVRWGGPELLPHGSVRGAAILSGILLLVVTWQFFTKDLVLVEAGVFPRPEPRSVLWLVFYAVAFSEVVIRVGWTSLAAGLTRRPGRAVAVAALCISLMEQSSLQVPGAMSSAWWASVYLSSLARECLLGIVAYRHGVLIAMALHALYTLRWLLV